MHNLYYDVKIHSRACYNMLFKQCRASPRVKQWLASTYKLLVHEGNYAPRFLQALPSALAGLMPRVRILHIRNARLRFIRTDFFLALSRFKSVKSLTLFACRLNNMTQLRRIVSAFPQLTDLTMQDVEFAQRGAPSYAGASLFRAPSHMRLRYLYVAVDDECMAMFLDWMTHSGLCNSLADVTVWFDNSRASMALTPLNQLLETAGASLTRFCERLYSNVNHGNLLQNTALQSLNIELELGSLRLTAQLQVPRAAWTKATDELHGTFSTIRSSQLEHIELEVNVEVDYYHSLLKSEEPSVVLEKLDLHEVMSQPYFDTLQDVKVKMRLVPSFLQTKSDEDSIAQKLQAMFHSILQPWSDRGIVTVTWQRLP
ncbi:uncharacterized protein B0H18DRAFT_1116244 [Fomitopsis serialis]|uniref:uncharacterized protein n=1 Tax=Fomitopsis serialis TaxID=139415 RepID=UPI002007EE75|nr:uncharacterized protein B0H18DRAFT_1116244 [Neoantrodia serialis]KAH9931430.1 hypothetical protein B0H18DRAFT_1116244 [Neoantrodia serialis]